MGRLWNREMPRSTYEAEVDAAIERDRARRELRERLGDPDRYVIAFADGCTSWLTYLYPAWAETGLRAVQTRSRRPDLWAGAYLIPFRRDPNDRNRKLHRDTGEELRPWHDCPTHNDRTRGEQP